jgi:hypothetical protein
MRRVGQYRYRYGNGRGPATAREVRDGTTEAFTGRFQALYRIVIVCYNSNSQDIACRKFVRDFLDIVVNDSTDESHGAGLVLKQRYPSCQAR